jgi:threonyl-tRNA synthetase
VLEALLAAGFRATLDQRPEKINAKIRDAQLEKIPAMLVVGAKEAEQQAVSYRDRIAGDLGAMPLAQAIARLKQEADARTVPPAAAAPAPAAAEDGGEQHTY